MRPPVLLGIGAALVAAALFAMLTGGDAVLVKIPAAPTSTSTGSLQPVASVVPTLVLPPLPQIDTRSAPSASPALPTAATSTKKEPATSTAPQTKPTVTAPTPPTPSATPVSAPVSEPKSILNGAAARLALASVNIICSPDSSTKSLNTISGSGVIIDPRGIILTDAHIGQFFLLQGQAAPYTFRCVIRTGSPARNSYLAAPIYVSGAWIRANTAVITEHQPTGTGANDIALLGITSSATNSSLPSEFPYAPLSFVTSATGDPVVITSYAAQFLNATTIASGLTQTVVYTTIKDVFTFDTDTVDVLSLGGSIAAQEGSSGGGVAAPSGELVGVITTSTVTGDLTKRELHALTPSYIKRSVRSDTGNSFDSLLSGTVPNLIEGFKNTANTLALLLIQQIQNN